MSTMMTTSQVIEGRSGLFHAGNNAGDGFAPAELPNRAAYAAQTTDDVSVYEVDGGWLLVADVHGPWAVRIPPT